MKLTIEEIQTIIHASKTKKILSVPKLNFAIPKMGKGIQEDTVQLSKRELFKRVLRKDYTTKPVKINMNGIDSEWIMFENSQMGSQDAFWGIDNKSGELFYVKYADSAEKEAHIESEILASKLYKLAEIDAPEMFPIIIDSKQKGLASKFEENLEKAALSKQLFDGFAADAWLANWDSLVSGNTFINNGKLFKLDNGGALRYRAMGELKPDFGDKVNEIITLIDGRNNSSKVYSSMNKNELIKSFEKVCRISDKAINITVNDKELAKILINRKKYLQDVLEEIKKTSEINEPLNKYFAKIKKIVEEKYIFNAEDFQENISKILTENIKYSNKGLTFQSTYSIAKAIVNEIKVLEKRGIKISQKNVTDLLQQLANEGVDFGKREHRKYLQQLLDMDSIYSGLFKNLYFISKSTPMKDGEKISLYLNRLTKIREKRLKQLENGRIKLIKSKLKYSDNDIVPPKRSLTQFERKKAIESLEQARISDASLDIYTIPKLSKNAGDKEIFEAWQKAHIGSFSFDNSSLQEAVMQIGGRYNSTNPILAKQKLSSGEVFAKKDYAQDFKYEPTYRWLSVPNPEKFVNGVLPQKGKIYTNNEIMCCSSHKHYAEVDYGDNLPDLNVKFIIHPKSETSRAYNLGYNQEVIYNSGENFRIIDKTQIEYIDKQTGQSMSRWEVHMQEV